MNPKVKTALKTAGAMVGITIVGLYAVYAVLYFTVVPAFHGVSK